MREHTKELLRLIEENVPGEFDKGKIEETEVWEDGKLTKVHEFEKGYETDSHDYYVQLDNILEYDFQIDDKPDMFQDMHELANKYQEAVSELSIKLAKLAEQGVVVTRPLTTTVPGGTKHEDGSISYSDWDVKPRPGSATMSMALNKFWLRSEQRYDSRKKAIIVELDILYGILK